MEFDPTAEPPEVAEIGRLEDRIVRQAATIARLRARVQALETGLRDYVELATVPIPDCDCDLCTCSRKARAALAETEVPA